MKMQSNLNVVWTNEAIMWQIKNKATGRKIIDW